MKFNDPENRALEFASVSGIGTAQGLAKVYGMIANGGVASDGKKLLSEKLLRTINEGGTPLIREEVLGVPAKISYGFMRIPYQVSKMICFCGISRN